jgi:hypothetical protein
MIVRRHRIAVRNQVISKRAVSATVLAKPVSYENLSAWVCLFVPSQIETQPIGRGNCFLYEGH